MINLVMIIILFLILLLLLNPSGGIEGFDGTGLVYNVPPNWFIKTQYNPSDWITNNYIDSIQPSCLTYNINSKYGSLEDLNYLKSAYRFWRF
jgi:hypothetical protein